MRIIKIFSIAFIAIAGFAMFAMDQSFIASFIEDSSTIGAIAESSEGLALEITKYYPKDATAPVRVLEVGAGTGVFTRELAKKLRPGDTLDVVELTQSFIPDLNKEFGSIPGVTIYPIDILELAEDEPYDFIVSGLPFNSFPPDLVSKILQKYERMSKNGTLISFFEYKALPTLRQFFRPNSEYQEVRKILESFVEHYEIGTGDVLFNLPPAIVHHLLMHK